MFSKRILTFLLAVICCTQLTVVASAQSARDSLQQSYSDVSTTSPYYEAVEYLTDAGVTSGVGAGQFAPDKIITFNEFIVMLMKTMQPDAVAHESAGTHWCAQSLWAAINAGVLSGPESGQLQRNGLTRMDAWHLICRASDFNPYPAWCYTQQAPTLDVDADIEYAMVSTGLYKELPDVSQGMPRGEAANLLYRIATSDYIPQQTPDLVIKTNMQMLSPTCWRMRNEAIYDLAILPQKYVEEFQRLGWSITLGSDMEEYDEDFPLAIGLTTEKRILLSNKLGDHYGSHTLIHEMGHFVARVTGLTVMLSDIKTLEEDGLASVTGSYCKTNKQEYFAEAFRYVLLYRNVEDEYVEIVRNAPLTVKFIEQAYLDADGLYSLDAVNAVSHAAFEMLHS